MFVVGNRRFWFDSFRDTAFVERPTVADDVIVELRSATADGPDVNADSFREYVAWDYTEDVTI